MEFERVGTGQMSTTYRLHLTYQGSPGPTTLIAKLAGEDEASRALVAPGYAAEVGFYTELAPGLQMRTPQCWYGAITAEKTRFTLLLDDASPAVPGVQVEGCTVAQASASLGNLIGLHAPRWNDPSLFEFEFLQRPEKSMAAMLSQVMSTATETFIDRYAGQLSDAEARVLRDTSAVIERWQLASPTPFSVIHGDYRLDNLLFDRATGDVTAVDWQTAAIGPPLRDVAYLLGTSLHHEDRRSNEEWLVRDYHSALVDHGVGDYDAGQCWEDYRLGQLQGPMITVIGCIYAGACRSEQSDAMFLAMASRSCAAIRELGSLDLV
ncbi:MAG: phosphotransferase [Acidimicrobiales bacterium]